MLKILNKIKNFFRPNRVIALSSSKKSFVAQTGGNYCSDAC